MDKSNLESDRDCIKSRRHKICITIKEYDMPFDTNLVSFAFLHEHFLNCVMIIASGCVVVCQPGGIYMYTGSHVENPDG